QAGLRLGGALEELEAGPGGTSAAPLEVGVPPLRRLMLHDRGMVIFIAIFEILGEAAHVTDAGALELAVARGWRPEALELGGASAVRERVLRKFVGHGRSSSNGSTLGMEKFRTFMVGVTSFTLLTFPQFSPKIPSVTADCQDGRRKILFCRCGVRVESRHR